jgi:hypothetical protein
MAGCTLISTERDSASHYTWSKRGQTAGELLKLYCEQGTDRDRKRFMYAVLTQSGGSTFVAQCRPIPEGL